MAEIPFMYMAYFGWFILRQLITCLACWWTSKPLEHAFILRLCFLCMDGVALTVIMVKSIAVMTSQEVAYCTRSNIEIDKYWKFIVFVTIVLFAFMLLAVCWCTCCSCVFTCFCFILCFVPEHLRPGWVQERRNTLPQINMAVR